MAEPIQLNARRAYEIGDSRLVSPLEQLKELVREIEDGKRNPDQLFVAMLTFDKTIPSAWRVNYVCAGVTFRDILALLDIMKDQVLHPT